MSSAHSDHHPIRQFFTGRAGGVSLPPFDSLNLGGGVGDDPGAVAANRQRVAATADVPAERIVWMQQVHGTEVAVVTEPASMPGIDGMVTAGTGLALAVLAADCVPVLAADPVAGVVGVAHAGRIGAAGGIARELVAAMVSLGSAPADLDVVLGPAICGACYEVPPDMQAEVEDSLPGSACSSSTGTPALDLRAGLAEQLRALGVCAVRVDPRCTKEDDQLFSHRRGAPTGRQAGLIWMPAR